MDLTEDEKRVLIHLLEELADNYACATCEDVDLSKLELEDMKAMSSALGSQRNIVQGLVAASYFQARIAGESMDEVKKRIEEDRL